MPTESTSRELAILQDDCIAAIPVAFLNGIAINEAVKADDTSKEPNKINRVFLFKIEKSEAHEIAKKGMTGKRYLTRSNRFRLGKKNKGTITHNTKIITLASLFFSKYKIPIIDIVITILPSKKTAFRKLPKGSRIVQDTDRRLMAAFIKEVVNPI